MTAEEIAKLNPDSKRILIVDSQIVTALQRCQWDAYLTFVRNRRSNVPSEVFERGDLSHKLFETFYKLKKYHDDKGEDFDKYFEDTLTQLIAIGREMYPNHHYDTETGEHIINTITQNLHFYRYDGMKVINVEKPFLIKILEDDELIAYYAGKIDLECELPNMGAPFPMDHKTRERKNQETALNNQFTGYAVAKQSDIVMVNEVGLQRSYAPKDKFIRKPVSYKRGVKARWIKNTQAWLRQLDFNLQNDYWPQSFNPFICGRCVFQRVCNSETDEDMSRILLTEFHEVEPWDVTKAMEDVPTE